MSAAPLIDVQTLAARLGEPRLLIVDCRFDLANTGWGAAEYAAAHIPGAYYAHLDADLSGPRDARNGRHPLPSPEAFAQRLSAWGLRPDTEVVAYDQGNGAFAARLWWLLRALGHARVAVLDGGIAAWRAASLPLDREPAAAREAQAHAARPFADWLGTAEVEHALAGDEILLVDARSPERFAGLSEPIDPVAGHVPGARNHPLGDNLAGDGRFLPAAVLRERWLKTLDGRAPDQLVAMCGSGITACHNLLAMEIAGLHGGRLYAGSWSEWIRDPQRPVATAS